MHTHTLLHTTCHATLYRIFGIFGIFGIQCGVACGVQESVCVHVCVCVFVCMCVCVSHFFWVFSVACRESLASSAICDTHTHTHTHTRLHTLSHATLNTEKARAAGIKCEMCIVGDDCALPKDKVHTYMYTCIRTYVCIYIYIYKIYMYLYTCVYVYL